MDRVTNSARSRISTGYLTSRAGTSRCQCYGAKGGDAAKGGDVTDIPTGDEPAVTVALARLSAPVPDQILDQVIATLPAGRRSRLQQCMFRVDAERGALAVMLARGVLGERLAVSLQRVRLLCNALVTTWTRKRVSPGIHLFDVQ